MWGPPRRPPVRRWAQQLGEGAERRPGEGGDVLALERHGQRLGAQPPPGAHRAGLGDHEPLDALAQGLALGVGEGVQHIAAGAHVLALVGALDAAHVAYGVDGDDGLFVGEQDPVPVGLRQLAPRPVDVMAEGREDVAEVLALPGAGPGGDGALPDGERRVGHEGLLRDTVDGAQAVALRAGPDRRVGREGVGVEPFRRALRVVTGAGEEHPQGVGEGGDGADRGAGGGRGAPLFQGDRGRQSGDVLDLGRADLVDQPPGVGGHRLEVAALRLGVEGAEGERGLARSGHPGERDQRVLGMSTSMVRRLCSRAPRTRTYESAIPP